MRKLEALGMQHQATRRPRTTVAGVPDDGRAHRGEVGADLMFPAGFRRGLHEQRFSAPLEDPDPRQSGQASATRADLAVVFDQERRVDHEFGRPVDGRPAHERDVGLVDVALRETPRQGGIGFRRLGEQHDP